MNAHNDNQPLCRPDDGTTLICWIQINGITFGVFEDPPGDERLRYTLAITTGSQTFDDVPRTPMAFGDSTVNTDQNARTFSLELLGTATRQIWKALGSKPAEASRAEKILDVLSELIWIWNAAEVDEGHIKRITSRFEEVGVSKAEWLS
ncbi:MAG: hypothetical protein H6813_06700 [Phycisphaeraceae bacterium]|nr:hypothetical protein [Phycisphaeraceae bacterium]MCB9848160.1 hypothetical protein [Phycisphaeraceae bacterium]